MCLNGIYVGLFHSKNLLSPKPKHTSNCSGRHGARGGGKVKLDAVPSSLVAKNQPFLLLSEALYTIVCKLVLQAFNKNDSILTIGVNTSAFDMQLIPGFPAIHLQSI